MWIKSKTVMSWSSRKKKECIFILSEGNFLTFVFYLIVWCIEKTLRIYILFHIKKHYFLHFCCLFWKSSKAFGVFLSPSVLSICSLSIFERGCRLLCNAIVFGVCRSSLSNSLCQLMIPAPYLRYNSPYV